MIAPTHQDAFRLGDDRLQTEATRDCALRHEENCSEENQEGNQASKRRRWCPDEQPCAHSSTDDACQAKSFQDP
jgi:hypothetical protein